MGVSSFLLIALTCAEAGPRLYFPKGSLEEALFEDARDGTFHRLSLEQAALIASGVSSRDLLKYIQKIDSLYNHIALRWSMAKRSDIDKGKIILNFLHRTTFKTYHPYATEIQQTLDHGRFNCVSSTLLFNILCERFQVNTQGIEIPTHIYSGIVDPHSKKIAQEVQTTSPLGFWIKEIPYNEFISHPDIQSWKGKRFVGKVALVAVIYYNRGIYWISQKNYGKALPYYRRAYELDPSFPNLKTLLAALYNEWGNQFFETEIYLKAIETYRTGLFFLEPHAEEPIPLEKNLTSALINQANIAIHHRQWTQAQVFLQQAKGMGHFRDVIENNEKVLYYAWEKDRHEKIDARIHPH